MESGEAPSCSVFAFVSAHLIVRVSHAFNGARLTSVSCVIYATFSFDTLAYARVTRASSMTSGQVSTEEQYDLRTVSL